MSNPYLVLSTFVLIIVWLIFIRRRMMMQDTKSLPSVKIGNGQTIGGREEQDDYFSSASTVVGTIAILADGISGLSNGRLSSTLAVTTFIKEFLKLGDLTEVDAFFTKAARISNSEIIRQVAGAGGGTTLVAAVLDGERLHWGAVGDSVLLVYRNREFIAVNHKHTLEVLLQERVLTGEMSRKEARDNPMRNRLINYLGYDSFQNMEIGQEPFLLQPGDKVLLLSDGVYNTLSEVEMDRILSRNLSPDEAATLLIEEIERKRLKNQDNATVVILEPAI
ncbi:serine/threonine-protein phosphatase [Cohnella terricola]|uniref:Serine/threonine-protein phosphatase n=2 Tax=Cohnella terricola TaxID=1289167 RepID=A0A559J5F0_9BACL|nr:serine/threonine-protein phosphatase [Cohnella terricola]